MISSLFKASVFVYRSGKTALLGIFIVCCLLSSCQETPQRKPKDKTPAAPAVPELSIPTFKEDSAYAWIAKQVAFGPRVPNSAAHFACADWLFAEFSRHGAEVQFQEAPATAYDGTVLQMKNVIASFYPAKTRRIMLSAHWDSRHIAEKDPDETKKNQPILGANDGASGVGVLLEIARLVGEAAPQVGVDIFLWDAEDYGNPAGGDNESWGLGSQYWADNKHLSTYSPLYGINLDMVGAKDATFPREGYSMYYAKRIVNRIWGIAQSLGYGNYFVNLQTDPIIDDHTFINEKAGIPMLDIVHMPDGKGFFAEHHTAADDLSVIDRATLKAVGHTLVTLIYQQN